MNIRTVARHAASVAAVGLVAGAFVVGSQALKGSHPGAADVIDSPSPTPIVDACISPDACPSPVAVCVPGEGVTCDSSPAPIPVTLPTPDSQGVGGGPPVARGVPGQVQASASWFVAGSIGVAVAVSYNSNWVAGASVTVRCTGPGYDESASGTTAARGTWDAAANGPQPPTSPDSYFWAKLPGAAGTVSGEHYVCHGTVSYNGASDTF